MLVNESLSYLRLSHLLIVWTILQYTRSVSPLLSQSRESFVILLLKCGKFPVFPHKTDRSTTLSLQDRSPSDPLSHFLRSLPEVLHLTALLFHSFHTFHKVFLTLVIPLMSDVFLPYLILSVEKSPWSKHFSH